MLVRGVVAWDRAPVRDGLGGIRGCSAARLLLLLLLWLLRRVVRGRGGRHGTGPAASTNTTTTRANTSGGDGETWSRGHPRTSLAHAPQHAANTQCRSQEMCPQHEGCRGGIAANASAHVSRDACSGWSETAIGNSGVRREGEERRGTHPALSSGPCPAHPTAWSHCWPG